MSRERSLAAIGRFRAACADHRLVLAAFLGGSYAAGRARPDSDIDLYVVTEPDDYPPFTAERATFVHLVGQADRAPRRLELRGARVRHDRHYVADGVHGEVAYGTTANFMALHGGPHEVLVDKTGLLSGPVFPCSDAR